MVGAIREICIFVIIAQAVMFFVPGNSYMKYVRILVGILMILKITEPVFGLLLDEDGKREIENRAALLEREIDLKSGELDLEDGSVEIYESITEELRSHFNDCGSGYEVLGVELTKDQRIVVTVREMSGEEKESHKIQVETVVIGKDARQKRSGTQEEQALKEMFGNCISVDAERIEILFQN